MPWKVGEIKKKSFQLSKTRLTTSIQGKDSTHTRLRSRLNAVETDNTQTFSSSWMESRLREGTGGGGGMGEEEEKHGDYLKKTLISVQFTPFGEWVVMGT